MTAALRIAALSAAAGLSAGAASADLTAAQVWADWQESSAEMGQTLSVGAEEAAGGTLTLRDVSIIMDSPDGGANMTIFEIVMTEVGDGTVAVAMSPEIPVDFTSTGVDGEVVTFSVVLEQPDLTLSASGDPEAISYTYALPQLTVRLAEMTVDEEPFDIRMTVTIAGIEGASLVTAGDTRETETSVRADSVAAIIGGVDPEGSGDSFDITVNMADIFSESTGATSPLMSMGNLGEMLANGFSSEGTLSHGTSTFTATGTSEGAAFDVSGAYDSGVYGVSIGGSGMEYDYVGKGFSLRFSGDALPLLPDVSLAAEEIGSRFAMPVAVSDDPQDAGIALRLVGLTLSDGIWAMIDPMGGLPHDPATLVLDITGRANWLIDIFDPAVSQGPMDAAPGEVHSVTVNELRLDAIGAELTGTGAFEFDNSGPVPQPAGTMNLQLVGGNALIDSLVRMGMLPEDQAMGARMMLGLFARPGDGPDTLVSEITVQPDGAILANGQRLQ
jgi:hypothetical protein